MPFLVNNTISLVIHTSLAQAKSGVAATELRRAFAQRSVGRRYLSLLCGCPTPGPRAGCLGESATAVAVVSGDADIRAVSAAGSAVAEGEGDSSQHSHGPSRLKSAQSVHSSPSRLMYVNPGSRCRCGKRNHVMGSPDRHGRRHFDFG